MSNYALQAAGFRCCLLRGFSLHEKLKRADHFSQLSSFVVHPRGIVASTIFVITHVPKADCAVTFWRGVTWSNRTINNPLAQSQWKLLNCWIKMLSSRFQSKLKRDRYPDRKKKKGNEKEMKRGHSTPRENYFHRVATPVNAAHGHRENLPSFFRNRGEYFIRGRGLQRVTTPRANDKHPLFLLSRIFHPFSRNPL